jgi:hypothetical protein
MVVMLTVIGVIALLGGAAVVDHLRRRSALEAALPAGVSRANRRVIIRAGRRERRDAEALYKATHEGFGGGGEFQ